MYKFDLCSTLTELTGRLDPDASSARRSFLFAAAEPAHSGVVGRQVPAVRRAPQWHALILQAGGRRAQAHRCVLRPIDRLSEGPRLYDDSIVILTSDHGDYYGEGGDGRMRSIWRPRHQNPAHHACAAEAAERAAVGIPSAVAMLTDVTPTLYELLGYGPVPPGNSLAGLSSDRPAAASVAARDMSLMQSSYSRIFGLLDRACPVALRRQRQRGARGVL